jgi:predicted MPP superfamily phosphohydrolase
VYLKDWGQQTFKGVCRDNETKMVVVVRHRNILSIQLPRLDVLEILHISDAHSSDAQRANVKAKLGVVEGVQE